MRQLKIKFAFSFKALLFSQIHIFAKYFCFVHIITLSLLMPIKLCQFLGTFFLIFEICSQTSLLYHYSHEKNATKNISENAAWASHKMVSNFYFSKKWYYFYIFLNNFTKIMSAYAIFLVNILGIFFTCLFMTLLFAKVILFLRNGSYEN